MNNSQAYIAGMNIPLITFGHGVAHGQGACLLFHGGMSCAAKDQNIKFDDTRYGFVPHGGQTYYLSRIPGEMGVFLALTGWEMNGVDALELGLVHHITPKEPNIPILDNFRDDLRHYKQMDL